jgi:hypothetical protein
MTATKAADLPSGSVVATEFTAWIKSEPGWWQVTGDEVSETEDDVQDFLNEGAQVLRVGDGR